MMYPHDVHRTMACPRVFSAVAPHGKYFAEIWQFFVFRVIYLTLHFDTVFCFSTVDFPRRVRNNRVSTEFVIFVRFRDVVF